MTASPSPAQAGAERRVPKKGRLRQRERIQLPEDAGPIVTRRLTLLGMRPINNVVDASNYVMLELGQPSHPYDLALVPGGGLRVRRARDGETLTTLDGVERRFRRYGRYSGLAFWLYLTKDWVLG